MWLLLLLGLRDSWGSGGRALRLGNNWRQTDGWVHLQRLWSLLRFLNMMGLLQMLLRWWRLLLLLSEFLLLLLLLLPHVSVSHLLPRLLLLWLLLSM